MDAAPEIRVKGLAFTTVRATLEALRGPGFAEDVLAAMTGPGADALRSRSILASSWYPIGWYRELHGAVASLTSLAFVREVGRESALRDITTVHRVIFKLLSPETILRQSQRLFRLYYESGNVNVLEARKGYARVRYTECIGFDRNVWEDYLGGAEAVFSAAGAKDLRLEVRAGGEGASMLAECTWR